MDPLSSDRRGGDKRQEKEGEEEEEKKKKKKKKKKEKKKKKLLAIQSLEKTFGDFMMTPCVGFTLVKHAWVSLTVSGLRLNRSANRDFFLSLFS